MNAQAAWPQAKVADLILDLQPGFACGAHNSNGTGVPHLRPMNVSTEGRIDRSVLKFVDFPFANRPERRLRHGDVLFNNTNSPELVGKTALFTDDDEPAFSNHMTRLRADPTRVDPQFLALMLHQAWRSGWFAVHCNNHVSQASIGRSVLETLEISLPPLEIQRWIGAVNARVAGSRRTADQHLSSARLAIDRFRQSVLAAACSGRLTANWRRAHPQDNVAFDHDATTTPIVAALTTKLRRGVNPDAPTDELIDSLQLPVTWSVKTTSRLLAEGILLDVKDGNHGATHPTAKEFSPEGVPFIAANNLKNGHIDYEHAQKLSRSVVARLRVGFAEPGDVLITHKGTVGRVAINTRPCILTPQTTYYRTKPSALLAEYLALYLQSILFRRQLDAVKSQTTRDFVPISEQYLLSIVLPPVAEQREIVELAARQLTALELLLQRIGNARNSLDRTAHSVLARALRRDLVESGDTQ